MPIGNHIHLNLTSMCGFSLNPPPPPPSVPERDTKKRKWIDDTRAKVSSQNLEKTRRSERHTPPPVKRKCGRQVDNACWRLGAADVHRLLAISPSSHLKLGHGLTVQRCLWTTIRVKMDSMSFRFLQALMAFRLLINASGGFQLSLVSDGPRGRRKSQSLFAM